MNLNLNTKQLNLLKDELESLVECTYDSITQPNTEDIDRLKELITINKQVCQVLQVNETNLRCYINCKNQLKLK